METLAAIQVLVPLLPDMVVMELGIAVLSALILLGLMASLTVEKHLA
jgi:hypothetical protein